MTEAKSDELSPILRAAREVFLERGFHGASVREIAHRAGLTVPALYYHHDSKEGLLLAVLTIGTEEIADRVACAADTEGSPAERMSRVVTTIVRWMCESSADAAVDASEARYLSESNRIPYAQARGRIEATVRALTAEGVDAGDFVVDDLAETVRAILLMTQAIPRWYHLDGRDSPEVIASRYARLVLRMLGRDPDEPGGVTAGR